MKRQMKSDSAGAKRRSADEVAESLLAILDSQLQMAHPQRVANVAQALTAFAEERVKENEESLLRAAEIASTKVYDVARAEALEEAAKVAEECGEFVPDGSVRGFANDVAEQIRALKGF